MQSSLSVTLLNNSHTVLSLWAMEFFTVIDSARICRFHGCCWHLVLCCFIEAYTINLGYWYEISVQQRWMGHWLVEFYMYICLLFTTEPHLYLTTITQMEICPIVIKYNVWNMKSHQGENFCWTWTEPRLNLLNLNLRFRFRFKVQGGGRWTSRSRFEVQANVPEPGPNRTPVRLVAVCYIPSVTSNKGTDHVFTVLTPGESVFVMHDLVVLALLVNEPLESFIIVYPK